METIKGIYSGKPCRVCGGTQRYVSSKRCVACKHNANVKAWEKVATNKKTIIKEIGVDKFKDLMIEKLKKHLDTVYGG
ncbi:hypothetical protein IOU64_004443 [Salmonella enterica]|nr:hypothetical protein [Salmonella enterica]